MMDFKLGSDGDLIFEDGKFSLLTTIQEAVRQRTQISLQTFLGEYFLNIAVGLPYRQQIFNKGLSKLEVDALFIREISRDADVIQVVDFNSTQVGRAYSLNYEVLTTDGLIRVNIPSITPNDEVQYNPANDLVVSPSCRTEGFMSGSDGDMINRVI
jgi:hypothetical protein